MAEDGITDLRQFGAWKRKEEPLKLPSERRIDAGLDTKPESTCSVAANMLVNLSFSQHQRPSFHPEGSEPVQNSE
jgi:hypothetical protein